jgi:hypothetical protein
MNDATNGLERAAVWSPSAAPSTCDIESLRSKVDALARSRTLNAGVARSLNAKLKSAAVLAARGNRNASANVLCAFANEVSALVKSKRLSASDGDALTSCPATLCALPRLKEGAVSGSGHQGKTKK